MLDVANGNFLKLSGDGVVLRATHGTTPLTVDEIHSYYGNERHWKHFDALKDTLKQTGMTDDGLFFVKSSRTRCTGKIVFNS